MWTILLKGLMMMKKILSTILPSLLIFTFIYRDSMFPYSKNIILGIYLLFPIIFIIQGICLNSKENMIIGFLLSSVSVILPISIYYNMSSMIPTVIIYLLLGVISFFYFWWSFSQYVREKTYYSLTLYFSKNLEHYILQFIVFLFHNKISF